MLICHYILLTPTQVAQTSAKQPKQSAVRHVIKPIHHSSFILFTTHRPPRNAVITTTTYLVLEANGKVKQSMNEQQTFTIIY